MIVGGPFQELELPDEHRLQPRHSAIFALVSPWPHRPLFASGRLAKGHSAISSPLNFLNSCARVTGVNPLRVLAA